jgi:F0F1-type ATP synthase assembly protein I
MVVGYFLDEYFGSSPWLLISSTTLAFVGAFIRLVRWAKFFSRERNAGRRQKNDFTN